MNKATPRPWFIDPNAPPFKGDNGIAVAAKEADGRTYGLCYVGGATPANAELIVRAVNNFDALLAAAVKVRAGIDAVIRAGGNVPVIDGIADLHKAICDAGGPTT